eukprot:SAG31_NODE_6258_length_2099_cov_4.347500_3_plen_230_part_00
MNRFEAELEGHFDTFIVEHGFSSAPECFKAISDAVAADTTQRKVQMEQIQVQLQKLQAQLVEEQQQNPDSGLMLPIMVLGGEQTAALEPEPETAPNAEDEFARTQWHIRKAQARRQKAREVALRCMEQPAVNPSSVSMNAEPTAQDSGVAAAAMPLMLFSQPIGLEQILQHTMSLTEYSTFSALMRMKAQEVQAQRVWQNSEAGRHARAEHIRGRLAAPTTEDLSAAGL